MDRLTLLYISFFLIACFIITVFAMIQAFLRHEKIKKLLNMLDQERSQLQIAEQKTQKLQKKISLLNVQAKLSDVDQVTQLMGWHIFTDRLNYGIKEALRYQLTMAVLLVDIDGLTMINDALGYEFSNAVLKEAADRISTNIRDVDSVARYSETIFAILLSQIIKPEAAVIVVQRILQALKLPFIIKDHELFVTGMVGISIFPADGQSVETLLNCARSALLLASSGGKNNYRFYQENMHRQSQRELILQTSLSKKEFNEDFLIYYQPILDVENNKISCMEALPYWQNSRIGNMNSVELFNYAESHQKLEALFEWLLKSGCEEFMKWRKDSPYPELIGIPLTIAQLESSHLVYHISQILQTSKFNPEWLLLEINAGLRPLSFDVLEKSFNMLNYLKIKICITNFGQESLSLYYLKNIKTEFVKLDSSLINDTVNNPRAILLIESLIFLTNKLSIKLIATGIESAEQYYLLKELGVLYMEGPFIAQPIAQKEVAKKMTELIQ